MASDVRTTLGANIRRIRKLRELTGQSLINRLSECGVKLLPSGLSDLENGRRKLTVEELLALAIVLNTSVVDLLTPADGSALKVAEGVEPLPRLWLEKWLSGETPWPPNADAKAFFGAASELRKTQHRVGMRPEVQEIPGLATRTRNQMSDKTGIEWTDATWNPISGCTEVSPGCDHCYAKTFAERWRGTPGHYFERGFDVQLRPDKLDWPLRKRKPLRIFVNSMSDLFHDQVPDDYIVQVFGVMALAPQHTFQVLTKRHGRMRALLRSERFQLQVEAEQYRQRPDGRPTTRDWPLRNVWAGVSTENQQWADIRIPALLDTPAAVRFISAEPLLGPIDLTRWLNGGFGQIAPDLHWCIAGGESGPGARPMHPSWARELRDQCTAAGVPFLFKQWGEYRLNGFLHTETGRSLTAREVTPFPANEHGFIPVMERVGKGRAGRTLGGRTWDEYPANA